jgi:hypothetical protein
MESIKLISKIMESYFSTKNYYEHNSKFIHGKQAIQILKACSEIKSKERTPRQKFIETKIKQ